MPRVSFEKFGSFGAVVAAAACPICFPKFALIGAALGLGVFAPFETYAVFAVQVLALLAFAGQVLAFRQYRNRWLLALSTATTLLLFLAFYAVPSTVLLQASLLGVAVASLWLVIESRRCAKCAAAASVGAPDA